MSQRIPTRWERTAPARTAVGRVAWHAVRSLTTPLLPEDYVDVLDPLRSPRHLRAKVVEVHPETGDASTVTLRPGHGWAGHAPGQYLRIGVDLDGVRLWRAYSVTSGPRDDGCVTITVKALSGGLVSSYLHSTLARGQVVHLEQAAGDFTWNGGVEPVLFVTGGSGITPVMGMLRHRLGAATPRRNPSTTANSAHLGDFRAHSADDIVVLHSATHPEDVIFADELRALADSGRIRLVERHTAYQGRFEPTMLDDVVPDWRERTVYACGPVGMLRALQEFAALNGTEDRLHTEQFVAERAEPGEGGHLRLEAADGVHELDLDGATSILDAAEAREILVPSGCRMGICYGCVLPLRAGSVRDLRTGEVIAGSTGDGVMVQTCVTSVAGSADLGR